MSTWRIRYVSDGGPVSRYNPRNWPHSSRPYKSLLAVMKALRDVVNSDARIGAELGVAIQFRLCAGEAWHWVSTEDTDRYAKELQLKNWKELRSCLSVEQVIAVLRITRGEDLP